MTDSHSYKKTPQKRALGATMPEIKLQDFFFFFFNEKGKSPQELRYSQIYVNLAFFVFLLSVLTNGEKGKITLEHFKVGLNAYH